jgi:putative MATE family efflux protein
MIRLAMPVLAESLLHVAVEYVDLFLAGNLLGSVAGNAPFVAAITQVGYIMWFLFNLFAVIAIGGTAMVARFVGSGDVAAASRVAGQALALGGALSAVLLVAGLPLIEGLVGVLQLRGDAAAYATSYLQIVLPLLPAIMIEEVGIACLRGAGDMTSGLVTMAIVNVINIVLSVSLLLGLGPLPELGWQGLAIGTAVARGAGAVIVLGLLFRGRAGLKITFRLLRPEANLMRRLLRIGVPGGVDALAVVGCHLWFISIINQLGTLETAAHGIGVRIEALAYMPGGAFAMAAATLAGQYLGAKDYTRAGRTVLAACAVGGGIMTLAGVLFYVAATPLSEFFLGGASSDVVPISAKLLRIVAFTMPALSLTMILTGALRGAGDTRWPLLFTLIGFLGIRIPLAYYFARSLIMLPGGYELTGLGLGVEGAWYAMAIDIFVRCALISLRFRHGGWKQVEV